MKRALAYASIPAMFFAGALAARASLAFAPANIAPDRAQPLVVVTAWGAYGGLTFAIFAATIALASLAALWIASRCELPTGRALYYVAAASLIACACWPFVFSSDVYAYAAYGDLAGRGVDPYALAPAGLHDATLDATRRQWTGTFPACVYGPAFVLFARTLVALANAAHASVHVTLALFRAGACVAFLATLACMRIALEPLEAARRGRTIAAFALNPIVLWSVAEGHNDAYALLFASIVAAVISRSREWFRAGLLPLAMLVKASAGLFAVAFVLDAVLVRRSRAAARDVAAAIAGTLATVALALPPLLPALRSVGTRGHYAPSVSLAAIVGPFVALAVASALCAIAIRTLAAGRRSGYAWLGLAAFAALPNPYPWYGLILVPFALADDRARVSQALYVVTICAGIRYLPDAVGNMSPSAALAASTFAVAPIAFALSGLKADIARLPKDRIPR